MDLSIFGWVGQDGDNIHKETNKNMPLKPILTILSHFRSTFFSFLGGGSDQALIQVAAYVSIC